MLLNLPRRVDNVKNADGSITMAIIKADATTMMDDRFRREDMSGSNKCIRNENLKKRYEIYLLTNSTIGK